MSIVDQLLERLARLEQRFAEPLRHGKHGRPGRDGRDGKDGVQGAPGRDGKSVSVADVVPVIEREVSKIPRPRDGVDGKDGAPGIDGKEGKAGRDGFDGNDGAPGAVGEMGPRGPRGLQGKAGEAGPRGPTGPMPKHEWRGAELRFEASPGEWGAWTNLRGPRGQAGGAGAAGRDGVDGVAGSPTDTDLSLYAPLAGAAFTGQVSFAANVVIPKTAGSGIKIDTASPDFGWRDMIGTINTRATGPTVPTFTTYRGNLFQYSFGTGAGAVEVFNEFHMAHDYVPATDLYIHSHWSTITAPTGNVNWLFELLYAKGYAQDTFDGTEGSGTPIIVSVTQASGEAFRHEIAEVQCSAPGGLISPAAVNVSITSGAPTLIAAAALFTSGDIGRTVRVLGAGTAGADLDTTVSAFTSTTQVTLANNASTTVTTQDAFRYRVLDSDLLEVDGMIMARTWRDSARAADTLDVAPFLHFVDIHYQSTGINGTKQRNGPGFYT